MDRGVGKISKNGISIAKAEAEHDFSNMNHIQNKQRSRWSVEHMTFDES